MKKKSRLFLNIATIALCLCAIAVGVYSAKTASLNVGGTVGFVAHNCEVEVVGKITGATNTVGSDTAGTYYITKTQASAPKTESEIINVGGSSGTSSAYFGNLHFTHNSDANANNIVMAFTITNKSAFDIQASIATTDTTTITGLTLATGVTATITNNDAEISANDSDTITLTISVAESADEDLADAVTGGISFNFEKASPYRLTGQVQKFADGYDVGSVSTPEGVTSTTTYADAFPYYIEMGEKNGTNLKWLVIGKMDSNNKVVALDNDDKAALEAQALLKNVDYVLLSEKSLETRAFHGSTNEYATSDIRAYFKDTSDSGFATKHGLTDSINTIKERTLDSLYAGDGNRTVPTSTTNSAVDTTADKFWLLSETEVTTIFAESAVTPSNSSTTYYMAARTNELSDTTSSAWWWLRSPGSTGYLWRARLLNDGVSDDCHVGDAHGVRAALII